jgi:hypothetical protein
MMAVEVSKTPPSCCRVKFPMGTGMCACLRRERGDDGTEWMGRRTIVAKVHRMLTCKVQTGQSLCKASKRYSVVLAVVLEDCGVSFLLVRSAKKSPLTPPPLFSGVRCSDDESTHSGCAV